MPRLYSASMASRSLGVGFILVSNFELLFSVALVWSLGAKIVCCKSLLPFQFQEMDSNIKFENELG